MSIAVVSDIHSNLEALRAVLSDAEARGASRVICLGDVVGYNADPEACTSLLRDLPDLVCLMGNHDAMASGVDDLEGINPLAHEAMTWTRRRLDDDALAWLGGLPLTHEEGAAAFVHASLVGPSRWPYVHGPLEVRSCLERWDGHACFVGHTHLQGAWSLDDDDCRMARGATIDLADAEAWLINVGSVGQPRDGDPRAGYALYEPDAGRATLVRVEYDVEAARAKIMAAGLPPKLAERLL